MRCFKACHVYSQKWHCSNILLQEELLALARAPSFWQQVRALNSAVQRGTIDGRQFGFEVTQPGLLGFLKGLQAHVDSNRQEQKGMWKLIGQGEPGGSGDDKMDEP